MPETASGFRPAALVTGGAQRIGRAIVRALARRGYAVAVQARRSCASADRLVGEVVAAGGRAATVEADLADHAAVLRLVPAAASAVGPLTLLVSNAAAFAPDETGHLDGDRFDRHVAVNLRAPIFLAEAFAAQVPAGGDAAIVNLLDDPRVLKPAPRLLSHDLTARALYAATTTLAQALAPRIRVNAVVPGPAPSPRAEAQSSARHMDVVDAVLYLASAASVTGATIAVAGGYDPDRPPADATAAEP